MCVVLRCVVAYFALHGVVWTNFAHTVCVFVLVFAHKSRNAWQKERALLENTTVDVSSQHWKLTVHWR